LDELESYTNRLLSEDQLRARMAEAARKRSEMFSRDSFVANFISRLLPEALPQKGTKAQNDL
jgi:hypothetical protein